MQMPAVRTAVLAAAKPRRKAPDLRHGMPRCAQRFSQEGARDDLWSLRSFIRAQTGAACKRKRKVLFGQVRCLRKSAALEARGQIEGQGGADGGH